MARSILYLLIAAAGAAALVSWVSDSTREQRQRNQTVHATRVLQEVLPVEDYDQPPGLQRILVRDAELPGSSEPLPAYPVTQNGRVVAIALNTVAANGYVAPISLLVGLTRDGEIVAVRAAGHRETPGLGDKIDITKSDWIRQFARRRLQPARQWNLRADGGDIDQISGATITSRAVVHAVRDALKYYDANQAALTIGSTEN